MVQALAGGLLGAVIYIKMPVMLNSPMHAAAGSSVGASWPG